MPKATVQASDEAGRYRHGYDAGRYVVRHHSTAYGAVDDLSAMRMRPYSRSDDDVRYCIIQGTHWDKAPNVRGAVKTPVKVPPTTHGVALHTGHHQHHRQILMYSLQRHRFHHHTKQRNWESRIKRRQLCAESGRTIIR